MRPPGVVIIAGAPLGFAITANWLTQIFGTSSVIIRLAMAEPVWVAWGVLRDVATW